MMILIRFLKRIFATIINKCKDFVSITVLLNNSYFRGSGKIATNNRLRSVINIISYTSVVGIIIYLFQPWAGPLCGNSETFQIFIFSIISIAIYMFISDKFKLSNNKFIQIPALG
jgi:hypothetical protein